MFEGIRVPERLEQEEDGPVLLLVHLRLHVVPSALDWPDRTVAPVYIVVTKLVIVEDVRVKTLQLPIKASLIRPAAALTRILRDLHDL